MYIINFVHSKHHPVVTQQAAPIEQTNVVSVPIPPGQLQQATPTDSPTQPGKSC